MFVLSGMVSHIKSGKVVSGWCSLTQPFIYKKVEVECSVTALIEDSLYLSLHVSLWL